ncbi:class I SAM-dependent methyltransferase [bacterium]|nr:class I SAM-dependent methyltransferase [bacterium]
MENDNRYSFNYDSKERFISYWHQIHEILTTNPQNVLEVGIGNGFVSEYLIKNGVNITTVDLEQRLEPDVVGDIHSLPFADSSFDAVSAFQVLEHLPFDDFQKGIAELARISRSHVLISLPHGRRYGNYKLPRIGEVLFPKLTGRWHLLSKEHFWELDYPGYKLKTVIGKIESCGLNVEKTYRIFENPYHRIFVLREKK